ncbi:MAG: alpha/beta fold hydrolase [Gemmatimonadaceae bacterium]
MTIIAMSASSAAAAQAPTAAPASLACNSDTVHIATPAGLIAGSVRCPSMPAPWPVVLLISGSGPTDRNGNSAMLPGENNALRMIAEALAARGIASVRYDKRGIGASRSAMGSEADLRFEMYADDAATWAQQLRADPRFSTVTIAGHSEGSLLGMLATQRAKADGYVSIAGVGRPADQVLHDQLAAGAPAALAAEADRAMALLVAGKTADSVSPALAALFRPSVQPYLISWFRYDPSAELRKLGVPVLIAQGTTDIQVAVADARLLAAADAKATLLIVDGMNHVLKLVPADQAAQVRSYSDPALPVAPQLIDAIATFVKGVRRR